MASREEHDDLSLTGRLSETASGVAMGLQHGLSVALGRADDGRGRAPDGRRVSPSMARGGEQEGSRGDILQSSHRYTTAAGMRRRNVHDLPFFAPLKGMSTIAALLMAAPRATAWAPC